MRKPPTSRLRVPLRSWPIFYLCAAAALGTGACVAGGAADDAGTVEGSGGSSRGVGGGGAGDGGGGGGGVGGNGMAGATGSGGVAGPGGTTGGAGGRSAGVGGLTGGGGTTAAGGRTGGAGTTGSGGMTVTGAGGGPTGVGGASAVCTAQASTATRPQLTTAQAANDTILKYLAQAGQQAALTTDNWNPTAGLGSVTAFPPDLVVAADGSGTQRTVQAALTAASGTARRYILVKPGTYREKISISTATPITIYGAGDPTQVVIINGLSSAAAGGTAQSATMTVGNNGFQIVNLTISNDFAGAATGDNQAVALFTQGDKIVMQNVRLHGFQDTLYIDSSSPTTVARVYIKGSFIEGDTDFIFGRATAVIDGSTINYLSSRKGTGSGVHLAPSTSVGNNLGFLVSGSNFTADATAPANKISLGRSWDQSSTVPTPNGQAVIRESTLGAHINRAAPWTTSTGGRVYSATGNRFFEYCNSGPGAAP